MSILLSPVVRFCPAPKPTAMFPARDWLNSQMPVVAEEAEAVGVEREVTDAVRGVDARRPVRFDEYIGHLRRAFGGRDVSFSRRVSEETGLQVVPCTGIYTYDYLPMFFVTRDADAMADLFVHDIEQSIQGTGIKAAFLKCAADEPGVTENIDKVHRAVARASVRTGAPIMAHSRPASETGPRQIEIFEEEGVDLSKVQLAHTGDTDDLDYIERVLEKGVYIGMDRYGLELFLPVERRNATVTALLERGYADRMLLSQDYCATLDWYSVETEKQLLAAGVAKGWSMTLVFEQVLPALQNEGVLSDEHVETIFVENPRRWLTAGR